MLPKRDKDKWRLSGKRQKPYGGLGNPQKENKETERNKNTVNVVENEKNRHDWTCNEKKMSENRDNRMVSYTRARLSLGKTYLNTHNG